jgi:hypothetical protein
MNSRSLIDAAIEDQERRLIAASPKEIARGLGWRGPYFIRTLKAFCSGGCRKQRYLSELYGNKKWMCMPCRQATGMRNRRAR